MRFPVFKALGASFAYLGAHFLTFLKLVWLPAALLTGVMAYAMPQMMDAQMQMLAIEESGDPNEIFSVLGPIAKTSGLIFLASLVLYPMLIAGVLKHIIRGDAPRMPFYLSFGGDELRLLLAYILLIVIVSIVAIAAMLGMTVLIAVLSVAAGAVPGEIAGAAFGLLMLAIIVAAIWFALRMSLIFPAAVGARSIGIGETWEATKDATIGLFFYWLVWMIFLAVLSTPVSLMMAGGFFSVFGEYFAAVMVDPSAAERLGEEFERRMLEAQAGMWDRSSAGFYLVLFATWLSLVIQYGLTSVAGGVAWRYLTGDERG
ncbi:hypothetical protein PUV54_10310 [Hyphococcus flavus]|uniref:Uncharacterized protein n=1 Tax=Hyphococcus flavus TaxID=1866326 RepID=A0AAE9ZGC6_9PROT|nr:hypothetical protein [Hyphococcus flavus]WDI30351.1 hypothetical protein PUV54_10310 [Hyphococcus flavus]